MDVSKTLQHEIDVHNDLVVEENDAQKKLLDIREKRANQIGKIDMLQQIRAEELKEASLKASSNGKGDTAPVKEALEELEDAPQSK